MGLRARNALNRFAELKLRLDRGVGLANSLKNIIYVATALKLLLNLTILQAIFSIPFIAVAYFILGALDLDKFKLFQKEQELATSKYNPHLNKIGKLNKRFK